MSSEKAYRALSAREQILRSIHIALEEDSGSGDVTSEATVPENTLAEGKFLAKSDGIVSGLEVVNDVFATVSDSIKVEWLVNDGDEVKTGQVFGYVRGHARALLTAERIALNFIQRMSGIATMTQAFVQCRKPGSNLHILDTRKTAPGLRMVDKLAVKHGRGTNHRVGLYDMVMIKDNHVTAAGGIKQALESTRRFFDAHPERKVPIEIEVRTLYELQELIEDGANDVQRIMLDNMVKVTENKEVDFSVLKQSLQLLQDSPLRHIETEASGNMTLQTVHAISDLSGLTHASIGALTHSVTAMDISLKISLLKE